VTKALAVLVFIVSLAFGGLALKDMYDIHAERSNKDTSRATHIITEEGSYRYLYSIDDEKIARLEASVRNKVLYFGVSFAVAAILFGLAEISERLGKKT
jgi:hypothetical protein